MSTTELLRRKYINFAKLEEEEYEHCLMHEASGRRREPVAQGPSFFAVVGTEPPGGEGSPFQVPWKGRATDNGPQDDCDLCQSQLQLKQRCTAARKMCCEDAE